MTKEEGLFHREKGQEGSAWGTWANSPIGKPDSHLLAAQGHSAQGWHLAKSM